MYTDSSTVLPVMQIFPAFIQNIEECSWNAAAATLVYDASEGEWVTMCLPQGQYCSGESLQPLAEDVLKSLPETNLEIPSLSTEQPSEGASKQRRRGRRNGHRGVKAASAKSSEVLRSDGSDEETSAVQQFPVLTSVDLTAFPPLPRTSAETSSTWQSHQAGAWGRRAECADSSSHFALADFRTSEPCARAVASDNQMSGCDETHVLAASLEACAGQSVPCPLGMACSVQQLGQSERLCAEFAAILGDHTTEQEDAIIEWVVQDVHELALSQFGCRLVQKLLDVLGGAGRDRLVAKLAPSTVSLYESPYGNHVLTKAIEVMPSAALAAIVQQVEAKGFWEVARHSFGCRVLERLIENCKEDQMRGLIDQLISNAEALCRHKFGNFVIQHLLEHGEEHCRAAVVEQLLPHMPYLAMHRTASHVVQQALNYSGTEAQLAIIRALLSAQGANSLTEVAASRYGSYVVEELAQLRCTWVVEDVRHRLTEAPLQLCTSAAFKRVATTYGLCPPYNSGNGDQAEL